MYKILSRMLFQHVVNGVDVILVCLNVWYTQKKKNLITAPYKNNLNIT